MEHVLIIFLFKNVYINFILFNLLYNTFDYLYIEFLFGDLNFARKDVRAIN